MRLFSLVIILIFCFNGSCQSTILKIQNEKGVSFFEIDYNVSIESSKEHAVKLCDLELHDSLILCFKNNRLVNALILDNENFKTNLEKSYVVKEFRLYNNSEGSYIDKIDTLIKKNNKVFSVNSLISKTEIIRIQFVGHFNKEVDSLKLQKRMNELTVCKNELRKKIAICLKDSSLQDSVRALYATYKMKKRLLSILKDNPRFSDFSLTQIDSIIKQNKDSISVIFSDFIPCSENINTFHISFTRNFFELVFEVSKIEKKNALERIVSRIPDDVYFTITSKDKEFIDVSVISLGSGSVPNGHQKEK